MSASGVTLWPLGLVCVWVVHDQKPFSQSTRAHTQAHKRTQFTSLSLRVFTLVSCLVCSLGWKQAFCSNCPGHFCSICVLSRPSCLSAPRCQWWWWNQPLRPFERRRPTRTESAASAANQMEGEVERAGLTETPTERSAQSTYCTCNSNRCVFDILFTDQPAYMHLWDLFCNPSHLCNSCEYVPYIV